MDPGFYGDLAGRLYGLLIGLEDRLNCDDSAIIRSSPAPAITASAAWSSWPCWCWA